MTNGDKIRSMSDMELSRELCKIAGVCSECLAQDMCDKGHTGFEQWLKEETEDAEYVESSERCRMSGLR